MKSNHIAESLKAIFSQKDPFKRPVPMIWGPPGVGKSQVVKQVCKKMFGSEAFYDIRLLLLDAVDLRGVPWVDKEKNIANWSIPSFLPPMDSDEDFVVFFDEINAAPPMIQAATYQLLLDRKLGEYTLPKGARLVAAGNRDKDRAVTNRMGTAMGTRLLHMDFECDFEAWCDWANQSGEIRPEIISFIRFKPEMLHNFKNEERTSPTPRTWQRVSDVLDLDVGKPLLETSMICGCVGEGAVHEFMAFLKVCRELPDLDELLKSSADTFKVPKDPSVQYAMIGGLAHRSTKQNLGKVLEFVDKFPKEFKVLFWKDARSRNIGLNETKAYTEFFTKKENRDIVFQREE